MDLTFREITAKKLFNELFAKISSSGDLDEQKSKLYWLLEERLGLSRTGIVANQPVIMKMDDWQQLEDDVIKLQKGYPVQHIIGKSWFYGRKFDINEDVLIPRPETEELVDLIIRENKAPGKKILDVGSGSGCITITLQLELPSAVVSGIDISEEALQIARKNAENLQSNINLIHRSIFDDPSGLPEVDILVSNPPYVPAREQENMQREVLHEPHIALFVEDSDPLIFYRRIAEVGKLILKEEGKLYFEIHADFGPATADLLRSAGYKNVRLISDIHNKDRIVTATK